MLNLIVLSVLYALASYFLIRFIETLALAILMLFYSIPFEYSILSINYLSHSLVHWNQTNTIMIYGLIQTLLFLVCVWVIVRLFKYHSMYWKQRLFLTWLAFMLSNYCFSGFFSGVLVYDGFGFAFFWMVPKLIIRLGIALLLLVLYVGMSGFWSVLFFSTAFSSTFIQSVRLQRKYILIAVVLPYIIMSFIVFIFNLPGINILLSLQVLYPYLYLILFMIYLPSAGRIKLSSKGRLKMNANQWIVYSVLLLLLLKLLSFLSIGLK